jgi:hypothetical protein
MRPGSFNRSLGFLILFPRADSSRVPQMGSPQAMHLMPFFDSQVTEEGRISTSSSIEIFSSIIFSIG